MPGVVAQDLSRHPARRDLNLSTLHQWKGQWKTDTILFRPRRRKDFRLLRAG
jgi:hypothetical protein